MDLLREDWFLKIVLPIVITIISLFGRWILEHIPKMREKQNIDNILSTVRIAHKEQLEILKASKEMNLSDDYSSINLYSNAEKWQQEVVKNTPSGRAQSSLLQLNPYTTANEMFSNCSEGNSLTVPKFVKPSEVLISLGGFLLSLFFVFYTLILIIYSVYIIISRQDFVGSMIILFVSFLYIIPAIMSFTILDAISLKISGSALADVFYRRIAHRNGKNVESSNNAVRSSRIRAIIADETIKDYIYIPKMERRLLGLGEVIPTLPIVRGAIVRATNYGYIRGLEDEYRKSPEELKNYKISSRIVAVLNLQESTTDNKSEEE